MLTDKTPEPAATSQKYMFDQVIYTPELNLQWNELKQRQSFNI